MHGWGRKKKGEEKTTDYFIGVAQIPTAQIPLVSIVKLERNKERSQIGVSPKIGDMQTEMSLCMIVSMD